MVGDVKYKGGRQGDWQAVRGTGTFPATPSQCWGLADRIRNMGN